MSCQINDWKCNEKKSCMQHSCILKSRNLNALLDVQDKTTGDAVPAPH